MTLDVKNCRKTQQQQQNLPNKAMQGLQNYSEMAEDVFRR